MKTKRMCILSQRNVYAALMMFHYYWTACDIICVYFKIYVHSYGRILLSFFSTATHVCAHQLKRFRKVRKRFSLVASWLVEVYLHTLLGTLNRVCCCRMNQNLSVCTHSQKAFVFICTPFFGGNSVHMMMIVVGKQAGGEISPIIYPH